MRKKSFFGIMLESYSIAYFVVNILPILIIIILLLVGYQLVYGNHVRKQYKDEEKNNIIFTSKFEDTIYKFAENVYDKETFSKIQLDDSSTKIYSTEINYYFSDPNKSIEEYDTLVKNEITKLYTVLKDKTITSDQFLVDNINVSIGMVFYYPINDDYHALCFTALKYTDETGFDEEIYQNIINSPMVTQEKLDFILKQ